MGSLLRWIVVLAVVFGGLYWWFAIDASMPASAHYAFDLAQIRKQADQIAGDKPTAIRYEHVASFRFPENMIVAGDGWAWSEMPVYAYQLIYAGHTVMIDTALDRATARPAFVAPFFDDEAFERLIKALTDTSMIIITHEHMDHIGGLATHPKVASLMSKVKMTDLQVANPQRMKPLVFPAEPLKNYQPVHYDQSLPVAPGVVLVAAPGHTPGTQMVYVKMADGKELLFLSDVAWHARNVQTQRERPRWCTGLVVDEDRVEVFGEIQTLHALAESNPEVLQVPGHDGEVIDALTRKGVLQPRFLQ